LPPPIKKEPVLPEPVFSKQEFSSPLEEKIPAHKDVPLVSEQRLDQTQAILSDLSFKVPAAYENRLRSCVQLFLKDIRSEDETKDVAMRSLAEGGLGLQKEAAEELIKKCHNHLQLMVEDSLVPMALPNSSKQPTAPPASGVLAGEKKQPNELAKLIDSSAHSTNFFDQKNVAPPVGSGIPKTSRPPMKDITDERPVEFGPIEELRYMSLIDFRRLAPHADEAAMRLGQKFVNLKLESVLLYFDALAAWRNSPLYKEYIERVLQSLKTHKKIETLLTDQTHIQLPEIYALIDMEKNIIR
jgi:hypothetical protein